MKICVILNPAAGRGVAGQRRAELEAALRRADLAYTLVATHSRGGATELAFQAIDRGFDCLVAVGGDGTINEVVNGIIGSRQRDLGDAKLGIIPLGTGSDFVRALAGFSDGDLNSSVQRITAGVTRPVDLGQIVVEAGNQELHRIFINGLGAGIDAQVAVEVPKITWLSGIGAYIVASMRALATYRPGVMSVRYDGKEFRRKLYFATIGNGRFQGGGFLMTPSGVIDDGLLDLCAVQSLRFDQVIRYYPKLIEGTHVSLRVVTTAQARSLSIASARPFPVATDGEVVATDASAVHIEVMPGAIQLLA
ncbi:diacylglycerol/lipid kinase family protein [Candidatus Chloroploca asiatica]|uniref:Diacylglycerol kinase n=1 Tax=Candidatus Chloroploca asiatica TaxID=1506545 RepID=A0A2H3L546_9CHLR|nr:diacylglycerol kinase family protein [Candidatus Chloroploca asiatica]PDV97360.1 diacylglycerol kinase [Candidatus Chloroploca asiatica]